MSDIKIANGGDHLNQLRSLVCDVKRAYDLLEDLIPQPGSRGSSDGRRATRVGSSPSWHAQAAYLVLELGQLVRGLERSMRGRVTNGSQSRGGSNANTFLALDSLVGFSSAVGEDDVIDAVASLRRWLVSARTALGEVEPWTRLPRQPGMEEPRCPWCGYLTLRYQAHSGHVRCVNPNCLDDDENHPAGTVELGRFSGELILAWRDGSIGLGAT